MDVTRSALIVASEEYTDPGLRRLRAPASDARALAAVLGDPGIGGFEVRTLVDEPAHVINLAVEEFFADRQPGDLLLMHYSGHGIKDEDGELYLAASNTVLGRLAATAVAAEFVSRRMNRGRSHRVVLLLDCCYAGAFERGLVARAITPIGIEQQFGGRGRAVITASSAMEYAFEAGELAVAEQSPPSVFTSALVMGLQTGEADRDQDGMVGLDELYDYVYDTVRATTPNQTPGKWILGMEGELYIARRSRPVTTPATLRSELQQAIDNPLPGIRIAAVQELVRVLRGRHVGMSLAARLALEQLTDDDSRTVATAAAAALGEWLASGDPAQAVARHPGFLEVDGTGIPGIAQTARTLLGTSATIELPASNVPHTTSSAPSKSALDPVLPAHLACTLGHTDRVHGVAFSPDGGLLATASVDGTAQLWDLASGEHVRALTLTSRPGAVNGVAFSPDGRLLATASWDKTARLWDPTTGEQLHTLADHEGAVWGVAFSPDGGLLATASGDGIARLWNPATGERLHTLADHNGAVYGVAFSPDGRLLATASDDGIARLWNPATGKQLHTLADHNGAVNGVAFSPDGRLLATASDDKTARLWNPATGEHLRTLADHSDRVGGVAFSWDGQLLATASDDKTALLWD
jgi:roadblock/LC7 domain-containing protein